MSALRNRANKVIAVEQAVPKQKRVGPPRNHTQSSNYSAPTKTTTHRYLLSRTLAVSTTVDWQANEADPYKASAFFRVLVRRLIDIH